MEAIEIALVPTAEQALKDAKNAAKEELQAFIDSDAVNAETISGTKNSTTLAANITTAEAAIADNGSIDKAKTIEAVEKIVSKIESDAAKTMRTALKANLKASYNSESKVVTDDGTNYSLTSEDYQKAYDAIDTATTVEEAVNAYNDAMEARVDIDALRESASDAIDEYVKENDGLNKYVVTATSSANYISDRRTYSREDDIATVIEAQKTAVSANTVNLSNVFTKLIEAQENIRKAVVDYAKAKVSDMYTNSNTYDLVLSSDDYLTAFKALQADKLSEEKALDIYETAAFARTNKWQSALDKKKTTALDELKDWNTTKYTYDSKKYTLSADEFVSAVNDATSVVNNAELVTETEGSYNAAAKEITDAINALKERFTNPDAEDAILDDTTLKAALSTTRTTATNNIDAYVNGTANGLTLTDGETTISNNKDDDTTPGSALKAVKFTNGDTLYDYVFDIVDSAKYSIKYDTDTVDEVTIYEVNAVKEILAQVRATLTDKTATLYNGGLLYTVEAGNIRKYFPEAAYTTAIQAINDSDNDLGAVITAYNTFVAAEATYAIDTKVDTLKTAVAAVDETLATKSGIQTIYDNLVKSLKNDSINSTVADSYIVTASTEITITFREYLNSELTKLREDAAEGDKEKFEAAIIKVSNANTLAAMEAAYSEAISD